MPRALAYVRYLPSHGCQLTVLTARNPAVPVYDPGLLQLVPAEVAVYRAWNPELPFRFRDRLWKAITRAKEEPVVVGEGQASSPTDTAGALRRSIRWAAQRALFPDPQVTWAGFAVRSAFHIVQQQAIDTVILNVPPFSTLKIGIALKRKFPRLKVVTDFRDEWVGYYLTNLDQPTPDKVHRARRLEARIVEASSFVSTVTERWVQQLRERYPEEPAGKFICTPNGYDPEMFREFTPRSRSDASIVITYFGTVHNNPVYSPDNYLNAIESLPDDIRCHIETRFIGRVAVGAQHLLRRTKATVRQLGFVPKEEGIRYLEESDFLLLIATDPGCHTAKLFEYLATGKPILALSARGGEIDQLLRRTRAGWCADPWDKPAIRSMIVSAYERAQSGAPIIDPDWDVINSYSWPVIVAGFARAIGIDTHPKQFSAKGG